MSFCVNKRSSGSQTHYLGKYRLYYSPVGEFPENLELMKQMDRLFTDDPTLGVLGMQDELVELGLTYNVKRIRR